MKIHATLFLFSLGIFLGACPPCPDGSCGPRTLVVTQVDQYVSEPGATTQYDMLPRADGGITVRVQAPDGTRTYVGTHTDAGYTVPNVAGIPYVVGVRDWLYEANADTIDLGQRTFGRPAPATATPGQASLELSVTGLSVWAAGDELHFFSPGASVYGYADEAGPLASPGEVPTSLYFDYGGLNGARTPLVSAAAGDTLWVAHMRSSSLSGLADGGASVPLACKRPIAMAQLTTLEMRAGGNQAQATFQTTPAMLTVQFPGLQWDAVAREVAPQITPTSAFLYLTAAPESTGPSLDLLACTASLGPPPLQRVGDIQAMVPATDGVPKGWLRRAQGGVDYQLTAIVKGASWTHRGQVWAEVAAGQPLRPGARAPRNLTLQGESALTVEAQDAGQPLVVAWSPNPAGTPANAYQLTLTQFPTTGTASPTVVAAHTRATTFTFPADTLKEGRVVTVRVRAIETTAPDSAPWRGVTRSAADALSRPFLVTP